VEELQGRRKKLHMGMMNLAREDLALALQAARDASAVPLPPPSPPAPSSRLHLQTCCSYDIFGLIYRGDATAAGVAFADGTPRHSRVTRPTVRPRYVCAIYLCLGRLAVTWSPLICDK
jgi:hypothetical protein